MNRNMKSSSGHADPKSGLSEKRVPNGKNGLRNKKDDNYVLVRNGKGTDKQD